MIFCAVVCVSQLAIEVNCPRYWVRPFPFIIITTTITKPARAPARAPSRPMRAPQTKGVLLQSVFGGAKSTGGAEGCAVPGFPEEEACLKARAQQLTLAALYSHAAVAHGLSCALDVLIFCQTRYRDTAWVGGKK